MAGRLNGKTAIVTGGGSGFGAGIAAAFAEEGARVMVADINGAGAQEVAQSINGIAHQVDVADPVSVKAMAAAAEANFGAVDILVNNAGVTHVSGPLEHVTEDEFELQFSDIFDQVAAFAKGAPIHMINPQVWQG